MGVYITCYTNAVSTENHECYQVYWQINICNCNAKDIE